MTESELPPRQSSPSTADADDSSRMTMAIIGCGRLGSAILKGILSTLAMHGGSFTIIEQTGERVRIPTRFLACVRTPESARRLRQDFSSYRPGRPAPAEQFRGYADPTVEVARGGNVTAARQSALVLLACQPPQVPGVLAEEGMAAALRGKLVISICAGLTEGRLRGHLKRALEEEEQEQGEGGGGKGVPPDRYRAEEYAIVHAMPNAASAVGESATIVSLGEEEGQGGAASSFRPTQRALYAWVFAGIGHAREVPARLMNAASITAGSTLGLVAPAMEGIIRGAVASGLDEDEALLLTAQAIKGAVDMVLVKGWRPDEIVDKVATPGGCTEAGLRVLEEGGVRDVFERSIKAAIAKAFELGGGE